MPSPLDNKIQDVGYTGETAEYFQLFHVTSRIERFEAELEQHRAAATNSDSSVSAPPSQDKGKKAMEGSGDKMGAAVKELFPFHGFFANSPAGDKLFGGKELDTDLEVARGCFRHISKVDAFYVLFRSFTECLQ